MTKMLTTLVFAAALVFPGSAAADMNVEEPNVEEWVAKCEGSKSGDDMCLGYTAGIRDALELNKPPSVCTPEYLTTRAVHETTMSLLRAMTRSGNYKTKNGRAAHLAALIASYPCKAGERL